MAASLNLCTGSLYVLRRYNLYFLLTFCLVFLCKFVDSEENELESNLLCKFCGADAADLNYAENIGSPAALRTINQTFSGKQVPVQTLKNPANIYFDVITVKKSNCIGYGEWSKANTWFPGYAWKVCVCQPWGHFLGWFLFNFIMTSPVSQSNDFLKELEEEFKDRYTEKDEDYKATSERKPSTPPVELNWTQNKGDYRGYYNHQYRWRNDRHYERGGYQSPHSNRDYNMHYNRGYKKDFNHGLKRGRDT